MTYSWTNWCWYNTQLAGLHLGWLKKPSVTSQLNCNQMTQSYWNILDQHVKYSSVDHMSMKSGHAGDGPLENPKMSHVLGQLLTETTFDIALISSRNFVYIVSSQFWRKTAHLSNQFQRKRGIHMFPFGQKYLILKWRSVKAPFTKFATIYRFNMNIKAFKTGQSRL